MTGKEEGGSDGFWKTIWFVISDTIILASILASIWAIHWLAKRFHFIEENTKLFDVLPIRYIVDLAELLVVVRYLRTQIMELGGEYLRSLIMEISNRLRKPKAPKELGSEKGLLPGEDHEKHS